MKVRLPTISLPLLAKELLEQSARRRTYVVRTLYACLLFLTSWLLFWQIFAAARTNPLAVLGQGRQMFSLLVGLQFAGICLFMPAITCGVLTLEKERNTLGLLFLTRLGPWAIIFEKLLGRLIPMFTFLLLLLPLLAFAYSMGGIPQAALWNGIWMLVLSTIQIGSLAVMCSALFRTTAGAFICTYLIALFLFFFLPSCEGLGIISFRTDFRQLGSILQQLNVIDGPWALPFLFFPPVVFDVYGVAGFAGKAFYVTLIRSIPILLSALFFLTVARLFLVRRAFVEPRNYLLKLFRYLDKLFWKANQNRVTRGIVLVKDSATLPKDDPVAWRETTKKALGTVRYLFRVLVALEVPVALVIVLIAQAHAGAQLWGASAMLFLVWIIAVLLLSVKSASLIAAERSHQTLDVLLTTPMTGREIIKQKFGGVRRLMYVLLVPFLTIILFETWWRDSVGSYRRSHSAFLYLTCSMLSLVVYLPLVSWVSFFIGLKVRNQTRAIVGSLAGIVGWCVLPLLFVTPLIGLFARSPRSGSGILFLTSPAVIIPFNEFSALEELGGSPGMAVFLNFLFYGVLLIAVRAKCLAAADRQLGRAGSG